MSQSGAQYDDRILVAKQRVYRLSLSLAAVASAMPAIILLHSNDPFRYLHLTIDLPALLLCLVLFLAVGRSRWMHACELVMLWGIVAFVAAWDVSNLAMGRLPTQGVVVSSAPVFLMACVLVSIAADRHTRLWLTLLVGGHLALTWTNLLRHAWGPVHVTEFSTDLVTVITVLLLTLLTMYQRLAASAETEARTMRALANTDPLTRLPNRRSMYDRLATARSPAVVLVDLDDFKWVNDTFGHPHGDEVLVTIARTLAAVNGPEQVVGRWGGEEFLVLLPDTDLADAIAWADRARIKVEGLAGVRTTTSMGVAIQGRNESISRLLSRADSELYRAKKQGKNRVSPDLDGFQPLTDFDLP